MLEACFCAFLVILNFISHVYSSSFQQFDVNVPRELSTADSHNKVVVCYVGTWATYRPVVGRFLLEDHLRPKLCTHLVYSFAALDNTTYTIKSHDPDLDLQDNYGKGWYQKMTALRNGHSNLKVLLAIGGWNAGSEGFSIMAASKEYRSAFIRSVVNFLETYGFDGLDLDWEYPGVRGGRPQDKANFVTLVKELRDAFKPRHWLLTAAVSASQETVEKAYDVKALAHLLDQIHLMTYDFHGMWDSVTGHNAPLEERDNESPHDKILNSRYAVKLYKKLGAPANKLVLGVPFYGRAFRLQDENVTYLGAPVLSETFQGPYTRQDGFLGYNEICEMISRESGWTREWSEEQKVPYAYQGDRWIGYDDAESITKKVEFAAAEGLKGIMIWSVDTDDFLPKCGNLQFPLLRTINYALHIANTTKSATTLDQSIGHRCIVEMTSLLYAFVILLQFLS